MRSDNVYYDDLTTYSFEPKLSEHCFIFDRRQVPFLDRIDPKLTIGVIVSTPKQTKTLTCDQELLIAEYHACHPLAKGVLP